VIRQLETADVEAAGDLAFAAWDSLEDQPDAARAYMASASKVQADVAERLATSVMLGAWLGDRLSGVVNYTTGPDDPYAEFPDPDAAGIRMLGVGLDARGRGVGAALIRACIERARSEGKGLLVLHTSPWMHAAQRLYPRLGFRRAPDRDFSPNPEVPLLGYTLDLKRYVAPPGRSATSARRKGEGATPEGRPPACRA
jgi:ribosomal protein S18 acetylase RimI-like enzyme